MSSSTIGLALGGGAARGWAHIGVLDALVKLGVRPDFVAGTSAGALVGAAYASGKLEDFTAWINSLSRFDVLRMLDVTMSGGGFIEGSRVMGRFAEQVHNTSIESLDPGFACIATDLQSGREVWLRQGPLVDALRASIALPGIFTPVWVDDRWLVDGGLVNPVPVSLCRAMGADLVLAVNLNGDLVSRTVGVTERNRPTPSGTPSGDTASTDDAQETDEKAAGWFPRNIRNLISFSRGDDRRRPGMFDVLSGSLNIMQDRITRSRMAGDPPDLVITPRLRHIGMMEFHRAEEASAEGYRSVQRMLPALEHLLGGIDQ